MKRPQDHPGIFWLKWVMLIGFFNFMTGRQIAIALRMFGWPYEQAVMLAGEISGGVCIFLFAVGIGLWIRGKPQTASVQFENRDDFVKELTTRIMAIGYVPAMQEAGVLVFKPNLLVGFLYGVLTVEIADGAATLIGPGMVVRELQKPKVI